MCMTEDLFQDTIPCTSGSSPNYSHIKWQISPKRWCMEGWWNIRPDRRPRMCTKFPLVENFQKKAQQHTTTTSLMRGCQVVIWSSCHGEDCVVQAFRKWLKLCWSKLSLRLFTKNVFVKQTVRAPFCWIKSSHLKHPLEMDLGCVFSQGAIETISVVLPCAEERQNVPWASCRHCMWPTFVEPKVVEVHDTMAIFCADGSRMQGLLVSRCSFLKRKTLGKATIHV